MTETTASSQPSADVQMCWFSATGLFPWWVILLWGILAFIIGVMFLASPGITTLVFVTFLGAYWLVSGIFSLISLAIDRTDMGWKIFLAGPTSLQVSSFSVIRCTLRSSSSHS